MDPIQRFKDGITTMQMVVRDLEAHGVWVTQSESLAYEVQDALCALYNMELALFNVALDPHDIEARFDDKSNEWVIRIVNLDD